MDDQTKAILGRVKRGDDPQSRVMASSTHFARKDLLNQGANALWANWSLTYTDACTNPNVSGIDPNAIIALRDAGTCSATGREIVICEHY